MDRRDFIGSVGAGLVGLLGLKNTVPGLGPGLIELPRRQMSEGLQLYRVNLPGDLQGWTTDRFTGERGLLYRSSDGRLLVLGFDQRPGRIFEPIDWFDQEDGDMILCVWARGKQEVWNVVGDPFWHLVDPAAPVEGVSIKDNSNYDVTSWKTPFLPLS